MPSPEVRVKPLSGELTLGSSSDHKRQCIIFNATSEAQAMTSMLAATTNFPTTLSVIVSGTTFNFVRGKYHVAPIILDNSDVPIFWEGDVEYELLGYTLEPYVTGDYESTFEIGSQSINIKRSISTVASYAASGTAPNFETFVNVAADGSVAGVDLDFPTFVWSETHYFADADVDETYIQNVYDLVNAPINDNTFRGFAAGTVKFLGMQGTRRHKGGDWELNYRFAASANVTGITIGTITGIAKKGWEYLWVYDQLTTQTVGGIIYPKITVVAVYVEKVYGESDYTGLVDL